MTESIQLLKFKDVAKSLNCSLSHVYKIAESGLLPSVQWPAVGGDKDRQRMIRRVRPSDLQSFISQHHTAA